MFDLSDIHTSTTAYKAYGYRRIYLELKNRGIKVSEKVVRRIMGEEGLII